MRRLEEKRLTIKFDLNFESVDLARAAITGILKEKIKPDEPHTDSDESNEFRLAIIEALNNAVEYSQAKSIEVILIVSEKEILFRMITDGEKFDSTIKAEMPDLNNADELPEGGFGLAIIQRMVDKLDYEYCEGKNILTLHKIIPANK